MKINPQTTQKILDEIKGRKAEVVDIDGLTIKVCPNVFPPKSEFSRSSEDLHKIFGDIEGTSILDVGTGTGIQALQAARKGARHVLAIDINDYALECARENVDSNKFSDIISVKKSDLFENVGNEKFDLIIANLPITDYPVDGIVESALYDPDYQLHKRFFGQVKDHLTEKGSIILTHANFKGEGDFEALEEMIDYYGLGVKDHVDENALGYTWRLYRLVVKLPKIGRITA